MQFLPFALNVGVPLGQAMWEHRQEIPGFVSDVAETASRLVETGRLPISRLGSAIVFGDAEGSQRLLAFVDHSGNYLEAIGATLDGLVTSREAISTSLTYVQHLSLLTLGVSLISPLVLVSQNAGLSQQLKSMSKALGDIKDMLTDGQLAQLNTGLDQLKIVMTKTVAEQLRPGMLNNAQQNLALAAQCFALGAQGAAQRHKPLNVVRLLSRNLAVAACGLARCHIEMGDDDTARQELERKATALRAVTRDLFQRTLGKDTERFLVPQLSGQIRVNSLVEIFEQARIAGILDLQDEVQAQLCRSASASNLFESLRPRLFRSWRWPFGAAAADLVAELNMALGSLEELNRVLGLQRFLEELRVRKEPAAKALRDLESRRGGDVPQAPFIAWTLS